MSALPSEQQSIAGGLLNTVSRLSAAIGLGIQTSIYTNAGGGAAASSPQGITSYRPYQSTFWVSVVGAFLALLFLPFLTIGRQGARNKGGPAKPQSSKV